LQRVASNVATPPAVGNPPWQHPLATSSPPVFGLNRTLSSNQPTMSLPPRVCVTTSRLLLVIVDEEAWVGSGVAGHREPRPLLQRRQYHCRHCHHRLRYHLVRERYGHDGSTDDDGHCLSGGGGGQSSFSVIPCRQQMVPTLTFLRLVGNRSSACLPMHIRMG
jgi:hypothetical protein